MQNAADHAAVIHAIFATYIPWQMGLDLPPLIVAQPKQVAPHLLCLSNHRARESATDSTINAFIGFQP
jgi:hypothetical protein